MSSESLVRLLYAEDKTVRNAAAMELGSRGVDGFEAAVPLLADASWVVRYRACEVIGMTRLPEAFPVLLRLLSDPRDHVRYMAVKGLGILGDVRALPDVVRMQEDENPFVRRIAGKVAADLS
ncbi:MAG TPA: HEAT repeat domain-containing protein [Methanocorpusculum sp.]|nr:HEAT repeat domain-containing protein [Methanocorpusculum sp.]